MITQHQKIQGFSLVEVLVAVTILLLVMAGPMRVLTQTTNSTAFSTEQAVAFFLAQEGLELVQLGRDNLVLGDFQDTLSGTNDDPNPWSQLANASVFGNCIDTGGSDTETICGLTPATAAPGFTVTACGDNIASTPNCRLYLQSTSTNRAVYSHTVGGTQTPYTRTIQIGIIPGSGSNPQGLVATSTVTWRTGSLIAGQKVELVTYLTNVYDTP
jgi:prepilin-type N-terminal cleavage/methylation domain-containing protein